MKRNEDGFTLIELLVVILILSVLAAIAIPMFAGQRDKAVDAEAKANARNVVAEMELCLHQNGTYTGCAATLSATTTGLPIGTGLGEVHVTDETANGYRVVSNSVADDGGAHIFYIDHTVGGTYDQTCTPAGSGGCSSAGDW